MSSFLIGMFVFVPCIGAPDIDKTNPHTLTELCDKERENMPAYWKCSNRTVNICENHMFTGQITINCCR